MASQTTSRALLLFGVAMGMSWLFAHFRGELGLTDVVYSHLHFALFWGSSAVSTWWASTSVPWGLRWSARAASLVATLAALAPSGALSPVLALMAKDAPTLLWATLFSASLALVTARESIFFGRWWWFLIAYRLVLHAAVWADALQLLSLGVAYPLFSALGQAMMMVLLAFSWLSLRFPERASEPA